VNKRRTFLGWESIPVVLVDEDLSKCRVLNNTEMLALMHRALLANSWRLSTFGGEDRRQRDAAVRMFAAEVTAQLLSSNMRLIQGPAEAVTGARLSNGASAPSAS
jgi:hypothetical protein